MKVLHVVNISFVLPFFIGEQFDYFNEKGVKFYVACAYSDHLLAYSKEKEFAVIPLNILREINLLEDIKSIWALKNAIKKNKIEIVIGHTPKGALIAMAASFLAGTKQRIYFRHGLMYETSKGLKRKLLKGIECLTGIMATKVVCVSTSVLEKSNNERLSSPAKNIILNKGTCNGVNIAKFSRSNVSEKAYQDLILQYDIKPKQKVVGYVGRLVNDKGMNELVKAWEIITKTHHDMKLLLVGPFEERDELTSEIKDFILNSPSIIYTGLITDVQPFYALMDIFILPSYREGFPTVVLEASSMELPVITTKSTGCIDSIVAGETGVFVNIDPIDIAEKIAYYLDNEEIAKLHGKQGRLFMEANFSQKLIWEEIERKILN